MKVTVKRVAGGEPVVLEISDDATVEDLMRKYGEDHKYDVKAVAFKGKNLKDRTAKLTSVGIVENEMCVVVGTKRKDDAKPAPTASAPTPAAPSATPAQPAAEEKPAETPAAAPAQPAQSETAATAAGAFLTGDAVDETVMMIMQMGDWSQEQVRAALRAAYNNPDRAVELLFSGQIPQNPQPAPAAPAAPAAGGAAPAAAAPTPAPTSGDDPMEDIASSDGGVHIPGLGTLTIDQFQQIIGILSQSNVTGLNPQAVAQFLQRFGSQPPQGGGASGASAGGAGGLSPLAQRLGQIREWEQIRQAVRNDRSALERVMQALRDQDPSLFELVRNNQEEFFRLLQEGIPGQAAAGGAGGGAGQQQTITLTPQDREALGRLQQLGFSEQQALQAYVLAERNEEVAANILFDLAGEMQN